LICSSRQPLLDAARVLLAEGAAPDTQIEMWHAGADHVALRTTLVTAAKLRVLEGSRDIVRFAQWSAFRDVALPTRTGGDRAEKPKPILVTGKGDFDEAA
jgi:hypothetical protein